MRKIPGLVIDDEGNILILGSRTNDDKPVALSQLTAEMILKVKAYDNYHYKLEKGDSPYPDN